MGEWVGSCRQWKQAGSHENAQAALTNAPEHRLCGAPVPVCLTDRVATETRECGVVGRATCGVTGRDDGRVGSIPWSYGRSASDPTGIAALIRCRTVLALGAVRWSEIL